MSIDQRLNDLGLQIPDASPGKLAPAVRTDNGKETRFNYDFRDGGVVLLRRGDKFVYVLDRNLAATIGMSVD